MDLLDVGFLTALLEPYGCKRYDRIKRCLLVGSHLLEPNPVLIHGILSTAVSEKALTGPAVDMASGRIAPGAAATVIGLFRRGAMTDLGQSRTHSDRRDRSATPKVGNHMRTHIRLWTVRG